MNHDLDKSLSEMSQEEQISFMEEWFRENFEDPAEQCPYRDGEYIYIYGGPYDAYEQLQEQFSDEVPEEVISQLAEDLSLECYEWSGKEEPEHIFDYIEPNPDYYEDFQNNLKTIEKIAELQFDKEVELHIFKLLYTNVITALETFLAEAFSTLINTNPNYKKKFLEKNADFKKEKICFASIYQAYEEIDPKIKKYLSNQIWHRLDKIESFYLAAFNVKFHESKKLIFSAIIKRHDLVHRGGKDKDGNSVDINKNSLSDLINNVGLFGIDLFTQLTRLEER